MSYSFKITKQDGKLTVDPDTKPEHIPDGTFYISGHEDTFLNSISISRTAPGLATAVVQASARGTALSWLPEPTAPAPEASH